MSGPLVTVRHDEDSYEVQRMCSVDSERYGIDVRAEVTFAPHETQTALAAVERMAESLRCQIADAAEGGS